MTTLFLAVYPFAVEVGVKFAQSEAGEAGRVPTF